MNNRRGQRQAPSRSHVPLNPAVAARQAPNQPQAIARAHPVVIGGQQNQPPIFPTSVQGGGPYRPASQGGPTGFRRPSQPVVSRYPQGYGGPLSAPPGVHLGPSSSSNVGRYAPNHAGRHTMAPGQLTYQQLQQIQQQEYNNTLMLSRQAGSNSTTPSASRSVSPIRSQPQQPQQPQWDFGGNSWHAVIPPTQQPPTQNSVEYPKPGADLSTLSSALTDTHSDASSEDTMMASARLASTLSGVKSKLPSVLSPSTTEAPTTTLEQALEFLKEHNKSSTSAAASLAKPPPRIVEVCMYNPHGGFVLPIREVTLRHDTTITTLIVEIQVLLDQNLGMADNKIKVSQQPRLLVCSVEMRLFASKQLEGFPRLEAKYVNPRKENGRVVGTDSLIWEVDGGQIAEYWNEYKRAILIDEPPAVSKDVITPKNPSGKEEFETTKPLFKVRTVARDGDSLIRKGIGHEFVYVGQLEYPVMSEPVSEPVSELMEHETKSKGKGKGKEKKIGPSFDLNSAVDLTAKSLQKIGEYGNPMKANGSELLLVAGILESMKDNATLYDPPSMEEEGVRAQPNNKEVFGMYEGLLAQGISPMPELTFRPVAEKELQTRDPKSWGHYQKIGGDPMIGAAFDLDKAEFQPVKPVWLGPKDADFPDYGVVKDTGGNTSMPMVPYQYIDASVFDQRSNLVEPANQEELNKYLKREENAKDLDVGDDDVYFPDPRRVSANPFNSAVMAEASKTPSSLASAGSKRANVVRGAAAKVKHNFKGNGTPKNFLSSVAGPNNAPDTSGGLAAKRRIAGQQGLSALNASHSLPNLVGGQADGDAGVTMAAQPPQEAQSPTKNANHTNLLLSILTQKGSGAVQQPITAFNTTSGASGSGMNVNASSFTAYPRVGSNIGGQSAAGFNNGYGAFNMSGGGPSFATYSRPSSSMANHPTNYFVDQSGGTGNGFGFNGVSNFNNTGANFDAASSFNAFNFDGFSRNMQSAFFPTTSSTQLRATTPAFKFSTSPTQQVSPTQRVSPDRANTTGARFPGAEYTGANNLQSGNIPNLGSFPGFGMGQNQSGQNMGGQNIGGDGMNGQAQNFEFNFNPPNNGSSGYNFGNIY